MDIFESILSNNEERVLDMLFSNSCVIENLLLTKNANRLNVLIFALKFKKFSMFDKILSKLTECGISIVNPFLFKHRLTGQNIFHFLVGHANINEVEKNEVTLLFNKLCNLSQNFVLEQDNEGYSCLHLVSQFGHYDLCELVLAVYRQQFRNFTPEAIAKCICAKNNRTALHFAAQLGHVKICRLLIEFFDGFDVSLVSIVGIDGRAALHLAAANGHVDCVTLMLQWKRSGKLLCALKTMSGLTPLHEACVNGHTEIAMRLLECSSNELSTLSCGDCGLSALSMAIEKKHYQLVKEVILRYDYICGMSSAETGVDLLFSLCLGSVTDVTTENLECLCWCIDSCICYCVKHCTKCSLTDSHYGNGHSALAVACQVGQMDLIQTILASASANGLSFSEIFHVSGKTGRNPLHFAAQNGHVELVDMFCKLDASLARCASVDGGFIPLHLGVSAPEKKCGDRIRLIQCLLKAYPEGVLTKNANGQIPLHFACNFAGNDSNLQFEFENNDAFNENERLILYLQNNIENMGVVNELLLVNLESLLLFDNQNNVALLYALKGGHLRLTRWLLRLYANLVSSLNSIRGEFHRNLLHFMCLVPFPEFGNEIIDWMERICQKIILKYRKISRQYFEQLYCVLMDELFVIFIDPVPTDTPLVLMADAAGLQITHLCAHSNNILLLTQFLRCVWKNRWVLSHLQVEFESVRSDISSLHVEVEGDSLDLKKLSTMLLATSSFGSNCFQIAAECGSFEVLSLLVKILSSGINVGLHQSKEGQLPLHFAAKNGHCSCVDLLLNTAADLHLLESHLLRNVPGIGSLLNIISSAENKFESDFFMKICLKYIEFGKAQHSTGDHPWEQGEFYFFFQESGNVRPLNAFLKCIVSQAQASTHISYDWKKFRRLLSTLFAYSNPVTRRILPSSTDVKVIGNTVASEGVSTTSTVRWEINLDELNITNESLWLRYRHLLRHLNWTARRDAFLLAHQCRKTVNCGADCVFCSIVMNESGVLVNCTADTRKLLYILHYKDICTNYIDIWSVIVSFL